MTCMDILRGMGRKKCIKMLLFVICVALKIKITPEITNYYYFTFYSRYSIINIIAVLNYFLGQASISRLKCTHLLVNNSLTVQHVYKRIICKERIFGGLEEGEEDGGRGE